MATFLRNYLSLRKYAENMSEYIQNDCHKDCRD